MNSYVTGRIIKELREKKNLTQAQLAEKMLVSDKAISKWETGKGYPDITLLEPLAQALDVSVAELLQGERIINANVSANMMRSHFYVCPICSNVIHTMGEAVISCHGVQLTPQEAIAAEEGHMPSVEVVEDEYFISIPHEMSKEHYISFLAAATMDGMHIIKLYPEQSAEARFKLRGVRRIYFYCNRDGLYYWNMKR